MADKASIVGTNDKGQFAVSVPRSAIERVDVIDIDLVLQTKGGDRLILPGAALEAMTAAPPAIRFSDGVAGAGELLSAVDKVQTPTTSIPAMTSLTQFDQKRTEGKKNLTQDGKDAAEQAAQQAQSQQVAPLPSDGRDASIDRMLAKAESLESDMRKKAFDPAPPEVYKPPAGETPKAGSQPPTAKIPLYLDLAEGNVVGSTTTPGVVTITGGGATRDYDNRISGTGGPSGTAVSDGIPTKDARQYATETLNGTANRDVIYADGFAGLGAYANTQAVYNTLDVDTGLPSAGNHLYYAKEVMLTMAGYIRTINSVTMSDLPAGVVAVIINGTTHVVNGGSLTIPTADIVPDAKPITLIYDVATVPTGQVTISVTVNGMGVTPINVTKKFVLDFQPVDSTDDVTNTSATYIAGSGYSDIYVMETASAPHSIDAGAGDDLVYGGNSADTVTAGAGDDIVLTYAGNDTIVAGLGANTVWAGNGNDTVIGGSGNDVLRGGNGNDILYGGAGTNVLDGGAGTADWVSFNGGAAITTASAALSNLLTYTGGDLSGVSVTLDANGDATVTRGGDTDSVFGVENVIGTTGNDVINAAAYATTHTLYGLAGNDVITGGGTADTLYGGAGNDTVLGGAGNDTLYAAITAGETSTPADVNTDVVAANASYTGASGIDIDSLNNVLDGGAGADTLVGGLGNDYFVAYTGQYTDGTSIDTFTGGGGTDTLDFGSYTTAIVLDPANSQAKTNNIIVAEFTGISQYLTGSGNDQFTGTSASETVYGNGGDDTFTSNGGNDVFYGGASSNNTNNGDRFYTTTDSTKTNILHGGSGYNYYQLNASTNTVIGGNDVDRIDYSNTNNSVIVNLSASDATVQFWSGTAFSGTTYTAQAGRGQLNNAANDVYRDDLAESKVDQIQGSGGADILIGNSLDNYFFPGGNTVNDVVFGRGGNDTIDMTAGSDYLDGGGAYEGAGGANGWATMTANGVVGGDTVNANNWNSAFVVTMAADGAAGTIVSGSTTTTIVGIENFIAGNLADTIYGTKDANYIYAGAGNDVIWGYGGDDIINLGGNAYNNASSGADNADADGGDPLVVGTAGTNDWVSYLGLASVGVEIHLETGQAGGWTQYSKVQVDASTAEYDNLRNFENAQGSNQADTIHGNSGVNTLWGMNGNDTLYGYDGNDVLDGGANNDALYGGNGNDTLNGGANNDTLDGGAGIDAMAGGTNDDTYYVDDSADTVTELVNEGVDRVYTTVSFTLTDNIEILTGQGAGNLTLTGNATVNTIYGSTGNDIIDGGGGNDSMQGGAGNDTYYVDATGDTVTESAGAGTDIVYTSVNYTLAANVENMTGQGATGLTLTGNSAANVITGTSGNDIISGGGGADSLIGGDGNDTFNTSSALISTVALFQGDTGTDTVVASGWTFAANSFNNAKWSGIEAINARDSSGADPYGMNGTDIRNIVDGGNSSALTLYLDTGDRFTVSTSDGYTCTVSNGNLNTGTALGAGTYTATYMSGATQVAQLTIVVA